jgi:hypothetical protein
MLRAVGSNFGLRAGPVLAGRMSPVTNRLTRQHDRRGSQTSKSTRRCSGAKAFCTASLVGSEITRMGWTGRAPAPQWL